MKLFQRDEAYGMMVRDLKTGAECQLCGSGGAGKDAAGISEDRIYVDADVGAVSISAGSWQMIWDWEKRCR